MSHNAALPVLAGGVIVGKIGVDNLRALRMNEPIEQRRLLLLVGRNGIGKSSRAPVSAAPSVCGPNSRAAAVVEGERG